MFSDECDQQPLVGNRSPINVLGPVHFSKASFTNLHKISQLRKLYLLHTVLCSNDHKTTKYEQNTICVDEITSINRYNTYRINLVYRQMKKYFNTAEKPRFW